MSQPRIHADLYGNKKDPTAAARMRASRFKKKTGVKFVVSPATHTFDLSDYTVRNPKCAACGRFMTTCDDFPCEPELPQIPPAPSITPPSAALKAHPAAVVGECP